MSTIPVRLISVRDTFGIDTDLQVPALVELGELTPAIDVGYRFNPEVTLALLAGFAHNRRVMVQGLHGSGKSSHIEQVAARLNWPCLRVNLDGHVSRMELIGKDSIVLEDGVQVTRFEPGILPWALQQPMALIFDEYDAGRPDVMFVIQRLLEKDGQLTLLEQNRVINPHAQFRLFATANTVGQGNVSGIYHGVHRLNHAQLDRWNLVARLNYLPPAQECAMIAAQNPALDNAAGLVLIRQMIALANLTRNGFAVGDIANLMSPRTVLTWAENLAFFPDPADAFRYTFLNKCEEEDRQVVAEYYQRVFGTELADSFAHNALAAPLSLQSAPSVAV